MRLTIDSEPAREWAVMLDKATTLEALREGVKSWDQIAGDAVDTVATWTEEDFGEWRVALAKERKGDFMGEGANDRFAAVLLPATMFQVTVVARQYHVPFKIAFDRLREVKRLVRSSDNRMRMLSDDEAARKAKRRSA